MRTLTSMLQVAPTPDDVALTVAAAAFARYASSRRSVWNVAVSGGSVAERVAPAVLNALISCGLRGPDIHIWLVDERFVAHDSPQRNVLAIDASCAHLRRSLKGTVDIYMHPAPASDDDISVHEAARRYGEEIQQHVRLDERGTPVFDLVLLGVGEDGHTASIFPGKPQATLETMAVCVGVTDSPKPPDKRISLTLPTIANADSVWAIATGLGKREALVEASRAHGNPAVSPISAALMNAEDAALFADAVAGGGVLASEREAALRQQADEQS